MSDTTGFVAYFDTKTNTTEVYAGQTARKIATLPNTKTKATVKAALKRRGFTVTGEGEYPYGFTFSG